MTKLRILLNFLTIFKIIFRFNLQQQSKFNAIQLHDRVIVNLCKIDKETALKAVDSSDAKFFLFKRGDQLICLNFDNKLEIINL